ncbi:uncharacterized protein FFUJ_09476 [Fusarium fujikuroi IMI 58289]|uniref:BTB domain-containing protein n=1 Tax=Gibberella fujikuroi (strain CBS 195.34 / IMI 58289 / NRRL A-6831) TaxID=1279085 RepID=S0EFD7_GIBF5|nr:uncharacterized protein FFUJ_09476 [Fusarium fujikuroi IMI 58289]CCT73706.1 uncharacterized protein FFUJ_09476 [Fusarium fujikuroi IMI 58289]VTT74157.1 unnamed protein product [Fusarium fujikuroi]
MPILNPSPESSTTRPDSNQSMPNQEGASLVERTPKPEIDIISDGNLVLVVGPDKKRIIITEQAARACSSVLADMLDQLDIIAADNMGLVSELVLRNDNPLTVLNAFGSIYPGHPHTNDLSPAEIYDVVVFAREYKMIPEFKKVAPNWFRPRFCGISLHPVHEFFGLGECWHLMMAAHYMRLDDPDALPDLHFAFSKLSERLVRDRDSYHNARLLEPGPDARDIEVDIYCGSMQQKWNNIVNFVAWEALDHASNQYLHGAMKAPTTMKASTCVGPEHREHEQLF